MANEKRNLLSVVGNDAETKKEIEQTLMDYEKLGKTKGLAAQIDLGAHYIASDIQKTKALNAMAYTMKELGTELKAYEKTLGRKLTAEEINEFKEKHATPTLFDDIDEDLFNRCARNLNKSKQIISKTTESIRK